nr:PREDICTED: proline-rich receptor-like protein kinase PERK4 [Musa acuminata subsp. malaccensis]
MSSSPPPGVVAGVGLFFVLMIIVCIRSSKKKNKRHNPMQYYADASAHNDTGLYGGGQPSNWDHRQQSANHVVKVTPPSGSSHAGRWQPQQHSTMMSGSEVSSAYSGPHMPPLPPPSPIVALGFNQSTFSYEELAAATDGFSDANLLGQGGFGYVHKGVLPNGKEIAVKQLKSGSGQGEREFQAEVDIISHIHHRHLVSLVGYCIAGAQRMLVYEFVPNNSLEHHLHGKGLPVMDWSMRLKIALGSARGIAYLHEDCNPRIIHRDIKSANILLDLNFEAMVADFGLAKLSSDNYTHVSTRVMGTFGYLAPEYASSGKLTEKSDVFSYGVMLLELITGRRPSDTTHALSEDCLVDWARHALSRALADGDYDELADPRLDGNYDPAEMARMVAAAAASIRHSARRRPKMSQIVRALEGDVSLEDLNEGMTPGHSMLFSSGSEYDSSSYTPNTKRVRKVVIASPEYSGQITGHERGHSASSSEGGRSGELRSHPPP